MKNFLKIIKNYLNKYYALRAEQYAKTRAWE